jgi:hypothetical protein
MHIARYSLLFCALGLLAGPSLGGCAAKKNSAASAVVPATEPAPPPAAESATFSAEGPVPGMVWTESGSMKMEFSVSLTMGDAVLGTMKADRSEADELTVRIGESWDETRREAVFEFGAQESIESQTMPDGETGTERTESPAAGTTFKIVQSGDDEEPVVTLEDGSSPSDEQIEAVREEWNGLPKSSSSGVEARLDGKTLSIGEIVESDAAAIAELLEFDDDDLQVKEGRLVFASIRDVDGERCAVFAVELKVVGADEEVLLTMDMAGEVVLSIAGLRPHAMVLTGPLTVSAESEEEQMSLSGGGSMSASILYKWAEQ